MHTIHSDKRKSGIPLIGDLPWGSHFCQFYQTKKDLLDIFVPYLKAGLENNELCVWVTSRALGAEDAKKALKKAVPNLDEYTKSGQMQLVPFNRCHAEGEDPGKAIISLIDKAVSGGFEGLRLACSALPAKEGGKVFACGADSIIRHNALAAFAYHRDRFDAISLMEVVKNHRFALVKNTGRWELLESSEARTVKDALRRSEEKLSSLFSNMSEGFAYHRIVLDANGKPCDYIFLEVNESFERLTGLKGKNIVGNKVTEVLRGIEEDPADWIGKYGKVALTGKPAQFESYSESLGKWFSISAFSPHKGYFAVTFSDVTEHKKYEDELLRSRLEWERTFDSVPDMIAILDTKHRIVRVNRAMAEQLGLTTEQCVGLPCYKYVHGLSAPPAFCPHSRTMGDGCQHFFELFEGRLGGDMLVSTTPILNDRGEITGSVHVARNISEIKQAERELSQRAVELEAANRELEAFSYSVSHDLRAPLRSIAGFSQILLEDYTDRLDTDGKDFLVRIHEATRRMSQLIDDLLNLSRMTRTEMRIESVNLSKVAGKIADTLMETQPEREVKFIIADGLFAEGDARLLTVVMENILNNAWKFTEKVTHAVIEFGLTQLWNAECGLRDEKSEIRIPKSEMIYYVRDNGAGFDMKYAKKLFGPFQRLHGENEFPGTGIGLATVKRIINRHGGQVWIDAEIDKGTTVYFTL